MENKPRIISFDIEASNLKGNIGRMLAFGWKELNDKRATVKGLDDFPETYKADPTNDKELVKYAKEILQDADVVIAHYGKFYDLPFINTRLLTYGLKPLTRLNIVDTWLIAKKRLALNSNRLATLTKVLHLPSKTEISWDDWAKATAGNIKSLQYIKTHCKIDVEVLEAVYLRLRALWPEHPALYLPGSKYEDVCTVCGGKHFISQGIRITGKSKYRRLSCLKCGSWVKGKVK